MAIPIRIFKTDAETWHGEIKIPTAEGPILIEVSVPEAPIRNFVRLHEDRMGADIGQATIEIARHQIEACIGQRLLELGMPGRAGAQEFLREPRDITAMVGPTRGGAHQFMVGRHRSRSHGWGAIGAKHRYRSHGAGYGVGQYSGVYDIQGNPCLTGRRGYGNSY